MSSLSSAHCSRQNKVPVMFFADSPAEASRNELLRPNLLTTLRSLLAVASAGWRVHVGSGYCGLGGARHRTRSEEHTSELQSRRDLVCRLLLEKKKKNKNNLLSSCKNSTNDVSHYDTM